MTPDGSTVYVANSASNSVSVIATATNTVTATIRVGTAPYGVAPCCVTVTPDGSKVYVANFLSNNVSVIATASNTVIGNPIPVGTNPGGVAVTPDGSKVFVANFGSNNVSVIATASNTVIGSPITLGGSPLALGLIGPPILTVAETGSGSGQVTSSPPGINCGSTCSSFSGTVVSLVEIPANGDSFAGWGGACSGVGTCIITMNEAQSVSANFNQGAGPASPLLAAVLPSSRSVEIGNTATTFATIINTGTTTVPACAIAPAGDLPVAFVYQTTNPATNALTGTANTPVNIAAGQAQSFVIALTPSSAFGATVVDFGFACANILEAPIDTGLTTLLLSASTTPVPDIVALAASGDPGYVDIPGATGTGVFAVATINLGTDAAITAAANTGSANLPVTLTVCQTNPATGACLAAPTPSVTTDIQPNATPTFGIFVTGSAAVANLPGVNRVFVTFTDAGGVLRGETSVAVRTQ